MQTLTEIPYTNKNLWINKLDNIVNNLITILQLQDTQWNDIDQYLILLAFTFPDIPVPHQLQQEFIKDFGIPTNSKFVLLGKEILQLIISYYLISQGYQNLLPEIVSKVMSQEILGEFIHNKELDIGYFYGKKLTEAEGKNLFLAIIGILYWDISQKMGPQFNGINYISTWLNKFLSFDSTIYNIADQLYST